MCGFIFFHAWWFVIHPGELWNTIAMKRWLSPYIQETNDILRFGAHCMVCPLPVLSTPFDRVFLIWSIFFVGSSHNVNEIISQRGCRMSLFHFIERRLGIGAKESRARRNAALEPSWIVSRANQILSSLSQWKHMLFLNEKHSMLDCCNIQWMGRADTTCLVQYGECQSGVEMLVYASFTSRYIVVLHLTTFKDVIMIAFLMRNTTIKQSLLFTGC